MPELPEVETIRLGLEKYLVGHVIQHVEVRLRKLFKGEVQKVQGAKVQGVRRRGKGLIIDLDNEMSIAAHVKMTGQFIYQGEALSVKREEGKGLRGGERNGKVAKPQSFKDAKKLKSFHPKLSLPVNLPNKYTHVVFHLNNATLFYNDIRQFGWLQVVKTSEVLDLPFFKGLGSEPPVVLQGRTMEGQAVLSLEVFKRVVRTGKLPIKQLLMDQKRIAGVGNIYANDALWLAKIDPRREGGNLSENEIEVLYETVLFVLKEGLKYQGASETNFFHVDGGKGEYQNHFLVYGKTGKPCSRCGSLIQRVVVGGRGTFLCPTCQK